MSAFDQPVASLEAKVMFWNVQRRTEFDTRTRPNETGEGAESCYLHGIDFIILALELNHIYVAMLHFKQTTMLA